MANSKIATIEVKSWSITPPTFEELWDQIEDPLNEQEIRTAKICAKDLYTLFYNDIKKQLEG